MTMVFGAMHYDLGPAERIRRGEGQTFNVDGREVAVFRPRLSDEIYATQARCPHRSGLIADGVGGDGKVIRPFHGYRFDLSTGAPLGNMCPSLRTYRTEITGDGHVLLWLAPAGAWSPTP